MKAHYQLYFLKPFSKLSYAQVNNKDNNTGIKTKKQKSEKKIWLNIQVASLGHLSNVKTSF